MRTITAVALALTMLFAVSNAANATTHKKHRHHAASTKKDTSKDATKDTTKEKAPAPK